MLQEDDKRYKNYIHPKVLEDLWLEDKDKTMNEFQSYYIGSKYTITEEDARHYWEALFHLLWESANGEWRWLHRQFYKGTEEIKDRGRLVNDCRKHLIKCQEGSCETQ